MSTQPDPTPDLNEIIAAAVTARVEAQTLAALSDSDTFAALVGAALGQVIEVPDGSSYGKKKVTYIRHTLEQMIKARTKELIAEAVEEQTDAIKVEVRKALRKSVGVIADSLVDGFVANASGRYPSISVEFKSE